MPMFYPMAMPQITGMSSRRTSVLLTILADFSLLPKEMMMPIAMDMGCRMPLKPKTTRIDPGVVAQRKHDFYKYIGDRYIGGSPPVISAPPLILFSGDWKQIKAAMRRDGCTEEDIEICGKVRANLKYRDHKRMKRQQQNEIARSIHEASRYHPYMVGNMVSKTSSPSTGPLSAAPAPSPFLTPSESTSQYRLPPGMCGGFVALPLSCLFRRTV
jgi:hypothetical protein